jgi:hypothetical protein
VAPTWHVAVDVDAVGAVEIAALLVPFESELAPDGRLQLEDGDSWTRVEVLTSDREERIELDLRSPAVELRRVTSMMRAR